MGKEYDEGSLRVVLISLSPGCSSVSGTLYFKLIAKWIQLKLKVPAFDHALKS